MRKVLSIVILSLALASAATGAEIFGTVSEGGKPLPEGVALKLACGEASATSKTDEFGSYSLRIAATGECQVSIDHKGATASLKVALYEKPSRYDLVIKQDAEGKLVLARK